MNTEHSTLNLIPIGQKVRIQDVKSTGGLHRRLLDLGLIQNTEVEVLHQSPSGDPKAYLIRGAVVALRTEDAKLIRVVEMA